MKSNFSLLNRLKSFKHAFDGLKVVFREEHNFRIHTCVLPFVLALGFLLDISKLEWVVVVFLIGWILVMEIINSIIEKLLDFVCPDDNEQVKKMKDMSAAFVLLSAVTSATIALIIFIPKVLAYCEV